MQKDYVFLGPFAQMSVFEIVFFFHLVLIRSSQFSCSSTYV